MQWTLAPLHEVLSETQANRALRETQMTRETMPLLRFSDAALQRLIKSGTEVKIGDIIRITRESFTTGTVFYYRRVIP